MRFLILAADYPAFTRWLYAERPGLERRPYAEQARVRRQALFNLPFFFADNLNKLGHEAHDIYVNNEPMQKTWAREHGLQSSRSRRWQFRFRRGIVPWFAKIEGAWLYDILAAQIRHYQPDVVLNQAMNTITTRFLQDLKPHIGLLVGQHAASPLPSGMDFGCYDLVVSSFPPTVEQFRRRGIAAELHRLGFDVECLSCMIGDQRPFDITFVGSLLSIHSSRVRLLEAVCSRLRQARVWTADADRIPSDSPIRKCCRGQAWGREMYTILGRSKITLNHHGDIAPYANNLRLYEATGMGALLVTDWRENLRDMFEPGAEVVTYRNVDECVDRIEHYLTHAEEREAIARAGHERTMREHTYYHRSKELVDILERYLCQPRR
jgi:hypothetical protein